MVLDPLSFLQAFGRLLYHYPNNFPIFFLSSEFFGDLHFVKKTILPTVSMDS
jgi:hypothetical protein